MEQAAEINKLFDAIDEVSEEARQARLTLERQIKQRKEEIRDEIVDTGMQEIESFINSQPDNFTAANNERFISRVDLESFTKGKRSTDSMQKAVDEAVAGVKHRITARANIIAANKSILDSIESEHTTLFQDHNALLGMETDALKKTVEERIAYHIKEQEKLAQQKPSEATPEEATRGTGSEIEDNRPSPEPAALAGVSVEGRFIISIEVFADKADATEFLDELEGRFADRDMVGEIKLSEE